MKKISVFFVTAILMIAFTACNGAKKTEAPAEQQPVKTDSVTNVAPAAAQDSVAAAAPATPAVNPADMLKSFQAYVKSYGEAYNNITKDPNKFTELSGQSQQKVAEMEQIKGQLNPAQLQAYQKAVELLIKINKGGK